ncbi:DUF3006 domain-containing protein [Corallococcus praedator]|uniref:DUF3006 domain-containing protein n=1 Tax=Corallococcus praedator TaxID=2316724 RepID=UPI001FC8FA29|nr:DUF3006 domain-containing protein [Corallococcus praedator]
MVLSSVMGAVFNVGKAAVERWRLPPGAREGDVIVDGRLDLERTEQLRREVARKRAALAVPLPPGLEL